MTSVFVVHGMVLTSWVVWLPEIRSVLDVGEAVLGTALLALSVGIIAALPVAGAAVPRIGSRAVTLAGAALTVLTLPTIGLATGVGAFATSLALVGIGTSAMNVGMNTQGIGVQVGYGRSIIVSMHAAWSVGSLLGAASGSVAIAADVPIVAHLAAVTVVVAATTVAAAPWLRLRDRADRRTRVDDPLPWLALPRAALLPIALVAFAASMGENTVTNWSGVYLEDVASVTGSQVGWGLVAYTAAQTAMRLFGDRVTDRLGAPATIAWGGRVATIGFVLLVGLPVLAVSLIGFALVAVGLAIMIPLAFALAAKVGPTPSEAIAAVGTVGHLGFLVAPPLVGTIAEHADLRASLAVIALAVAVLAGGRQRLARLAA